MNDEKITMLIPACDHPFEAAVQIILGLNAAGHEALLAGGCVRDMLLGRDPKDFDIATSATPDQVTDLFKGAKEVGKAFGVVIVNSDKLEGGGRWETEVATFRIDGEYLDGRRPDNVVFATAEEDAQRRDFTVNGLFAEIDPDNPYKFRVVDFVGGQEDLQKGVLRAIGDPQQRFKEDYLRLLRAVRFASRYGFSLDPNTAEAIKLNAKNLSKISRERIGNELRKMFADNAGLALSMIHDLDLAGPILGEEIGNKKSTFVNLSLPAKANFATRMAAWLVDRHNLSHPDLHGILKEWDKALCLTRDEFKEITQRIEHCKAMYKWDDLGIAERKRFVNSAINWYQNVIFFMAVDGTGNRFFAETRELMEDGVGLQPDPFLNGNDVIEAGVKPSPEVQVLLDKAYDLQLEGELKSRDEAMDWLAIAVPSAAE